MGRAFKAQAGFTYLGLLFAIAIIGITLATVGVVWSTEARRERETQLLFVGDQYRQAIGRYREAGRAYPRNLDDLLEDKRAPGTRRFLRRLYPDPVTGRAEWELIKDPGGGILGVASLSKQKPIKLAGFAPVDATFEKADCYCAWKFIYVGKPVGRPRELPRMSLPTQLGRARN